MTRPIEGGFNLKWLWWWGWGGWVKRARHEANTSRWRGLVRRIALDNGGGGVAERMKRERAEDYNSDGIASADFVFFDSFTHHGRFLLSWMRKEIWIHGS